MLLFFLIWANSHLWSVSKFFFDFLGPNYGLFKKLEPEFGQNFRHDHNQPCMYVGHSLKWYHWVLTKRNKLETNHFVFK